VRRWWRRAARIHVTSWLAPGNSEAASWSVEEQRRGSGRGVAPVVGSRLAVVSEIRDHEEPGAGINDVADDDVHVDHPQGARGLVLCCQLQVDVVVVVRCR
jgi:hypothetical protein